MSLSRERVVAAKARADAATDGPWERGEIQRFSESSYHVTYTEVEPAICAGVDVVDAEFIASAREDVPVMADALLRVLDIHTEKHGEAPRYAPDDVMHDGPIVGWEPYTMCAGCSVSPYPCATVRAVTGEGGDRG